MKKKKLIEEYKSLSIEDKKIFDKEYKKLKILKDKVKLYKNINTSEHFFSPDWVISNIFNNKN